MSKKFYINTKRPNLDYKKPEYKETKLTFADDTHHIMEGKKERFSQLKKRLQKRTC